MDTSIPEVLISYTHDSNLHKDRVLDLSNKLRDDGIDCHLDQYEQSPPEGWARWMQNQIEQVKYVLVVCTETYNRRFRGKEGPNKGLGAQWEGFVITQELYEDAAKNTKFIPVVFSAEDAQHIPSILRSATYYRVDVEEGYEDLYRRLTAQPRVLKPALGKRRIMPPFTNIQPLTEVESSERTRNETNEKVQPDLINRTVKNPNFVLFYLDVSRFMFIPSKRVEAGAEITTQLLPENARQTAFLADLQRQLHKQTFAVAYGDTAIEVQLENSTRIQEEVNDYWQVSLKPIKERFGRSPLGDFNFNGYTSEDMAELRARRILLNETPEVRRGRDRLSDQMVVSFISRGEGLIQTIESPLPMLYNQFQNDLPRFLAAARLMCVLYLQLSNTVEHIFNLNLRMENETEVLVEFEGQRAPLYVNAQPQLINFKGTCKLS